MDPAQSKALEEREQMRITRKLNSNDEQLLLNMTIANRTSLRNMPRTLFRC